MSKPRVIIRTLEDSPPRLDQSLITAYLATRYRVDWPDETGCFLTIGERESAFTDYREREKIGTCAIITASNPRSEMLGETENARRNLQLQADLARHTTLLFPAQNISLDGDWPPEAGFCAGGIQAETAVMLGHKYEQNAIVWWEKGGVVELWWLGETSPPRTSKGGKAPRLGLLIAYGMHTNMIDCQIITSVSYF